MDMKKRRDMQLLYVADEAIIEEQSVCRKKLQKLNFMDRSDFDGVAETVKDLFGKSSLSISRFPYRIWSSVSSRRLWWEAFCSFSFLIWITGARRNSGLRMTNIITM